MVKKFHIHDQTQVEPENQQGAKKFEIHSKHRFEIESDSTLATPHETLKKKFEIQKPAAGNEERFRVNWFKQENASDCGPMVILNTLIRTNTSNRPRSVHEILDAIALNRIRTGQSATARTGGEISTTGWLTSSDIWNYLRDNLGINAEILSNRPDMERVKRELINNASKFYILATGNHFKALRSTGSTFELIDSMYDGPRNVTREEAFSLLDRSVGLAGVLAG